MFKYVLIIVLSAFAFLVLTSYFSFQEDVQPPYDLQLAQDEQLLYINDETLTVEVADEPREQAKGLSGRDSMDQDRGMIFVFPDPIVAGFWMKEMRFPLDFLWVDEYGVIVEITKNVSPDTFPKTFSPSSPVLYVIEVNAGWSDDKNIRVGDKIELENGQAGQ